MSIEAATFIILLNVWILGYNVGVLKRRLTTIIKLLKDKHDY